MRVHAIGLTGNIGSGKSTVGSMLERLGCTRIDSDRVARDVMAPGLPAWRAVVELFGPNILLPDTTIDRVKLGERVFSDRDALLALDRAVHPWVRRAVKNILDSLVDGRVVVVEAVKLLEAGMDADVDAVWIVAAPDEVAIARLVGSRHMTRDDAAARLAAQAPVGPKLARADTIIDNGGSRRATEARVAHEFAKLQERWAGETGCSSGPNCATVT